MKRQTEIKSAVGSADDDPDVLVAMKAFAMVVDYANEHPEKPDKEIYKMASKAHFAIQSGNMRDGKLAPRILASDSAMKCLHKLGY